MYNLTHLGLAYRKAKVDYFYSAQSSLQLLIDYETQLYTNLNKLLSQINQDDETWVQTDKFLGDWSFIPKKIDLTNIKKNGEIFASPDDEWQYLCSLIKINSGEKPTAEFRIMAKCSIDFHVLSTLWLMQVGHLFESKLSQNAYGNRLRRDVNGDINELALGSFEPYLRPFRKWRDNGVEVIRNSLESGKKVVAITADITSFYHELNSDFMLDDIFLKEILEVELDPKQAKLNRLFITALNAWAAKTPLKKGLPVGLPASAVVANMALIDLDRFIEKQIVPLYYGRYVDDILLIIENGAEFKNSNEVWEWLIFRSRKLLTSNSDAINFEPNYLNKGSCKCKICFSNKKNKVFFLSGEQGRTLAASIARQIYERASEWRALPSLPQFANQVGSDLLTATQNDGDDADNLRKTDALTMRRAGFAIKLRDFEAYERDLPPETWHEHRQAFYQSFMQYVLVLPKFFDFAIYLPRVIKLATACEDFHELVKIIKRLIELCKAISDNCKITIIANTTNHIDEQDVYTRWQTKIFTTVYESIVAAFPVPLSKIGRQTWQKHIEFINLKLVFSDINLLLGWSVLNDRRIQKEQKKYFNFDLAHKPFRFIGLPKELVIQRGIPKNTNKSICANAEKILTAEPILVGIKMLANWLKLDEYSHGLLFATRPFNLPELYLLDIDIYSVQGQESLSDIMLALRGFNFYERKVCFDNKGVLCIPGDIKEAKIAVAVSSWKTEFDSWKAAAKKMPDPDLSRYTRLNKLLNTLIAQPHQSRYLILPELALPANWFIRIATKLRSKGISLITGIEYQHAKHSKVHNQVWAALSIENLGFPSFIIYKQDKQNPALAEEKGLFMLAGRVLSQAKKWKNNYPQPPIIKHGNFYFAILICSELTNISYRAALRGKIDALFVPEWNKDIDTFNSLVESAALDIHAYIIQCNDREYGDSRIRAPFKEGWARDILRIRGGLADYYVIGEIDIHALRQFQSNYRSPEGPFKPVPDGFSISYDRKELP